MSIIQGGLGLPILASVVFKYFTTGLTTNLEIPTEQLPSTLKYFVEQVFCIATHQFFGSACMESEGKPVYIVCVCLSVCLSVC